LKAIATLLYNIIQYYFVQELWVGTQIGDTDFFDELRAESGKMDLGIVEKLLDYPSL